MTGSYLEPQRSSEETFTRGGLEVTLRGWCYPLEAYVRAFEAAGLLVETLREPPDPRENPRHWRIPMFLMGRCLKRS